MGLTRIGARGAHYQSRLVQLPPSQSRAVLRACESRHVGTETCDATAFWGPKRGTGQNNVDESPLRLRCAPTLCGPKPWTPPLGELA